MFALIVAALKIGRVYFATRMVAAKGLVERK